LKGNEETASVILAAGRGSRMKDFEGNKTLLPLIPGKTPYEGDRPILLEILRNLPPGPRALVVNYRKKDIAKATRNMGLTYCEQPLLNGTGGALIAARPFLEKQHCDRIIITMGDVPHVRRATYEALGNELKGKGLVALGFEPKARKQYGVLSLEGDRIRRIIEWKYWREFPEKERRALRICNSGIYAATREDLLHYLSVLASRPHKVRKEIDGAHVKIHEFFITDLMEYMHEDGLPVGYVLAGDEEEVMGVDDLPALLKAQEVFQRKYGAG
jgi:bifunctional UDP-N-acetylglucosamine pyrophosphorylase / glucosamine-1-phosphate N-acetyltransferase